MIKLLAATLAISGAVSGLVPWPPTTPRSGQAEPPDPLADSYDPRPQPPMAPLDQISIALQRESCFGTCPSYQVEIRGDGTALYQGYGNVLVAGEHRDRVSPAAVQCLADFLNQAGFWGMQKSYEAPVTDHPTYRLTLTIGGVRKTVFDYVGERAGMPHAVTRVEDAVDRLVGQRWSEGDELTAARLADEGFNFRSEAGGSLLATAAAMSPETLTLDILRRGASARGVSKPRGWSRGQTAMSAAATRGKARLVRALIAAGAFAGPDARKQKADALIAAAASGDPDTVAVLLSQKPPLNRPARFGTPPLTVVGEQASDHIDPATRLKIVRMLLEAGADPRLADTDGNTALHSAASVEEVHLLLSRGAKVDVRNTYQDTPLMWAQSDDIAMALIEAGADYRAADPDGDSVAKQAAAGGYTRTIAFLKAHGVSVPDPASPPPPSDFFKPLPPQDNTPLCLV